MTRTVFILGLAVALAATAGAARAGEPDWFTRVREEGLARACGTEVARYERGVLEASLHVGECYYELGRHEAGLAVFRRLVRSPDRNYAAMAKARAAEGLYHLGRREEAREAFRAVLEEHPDAWLDGSVAEFCRAWLEKLAGNLVSPDAPKAPAAAAPADAVESLRAEVRELTDRLEELKSLLRRLTEEPK